MGVGAAGLCLTDEKVESGVGLWDDIYIYIGVGSRLFHTPTPTHSSSAALVGPSSYLYPFSLYLA